MQVKKKFIANLCLCGSICLALGLILGWQIFKSTDNKQDLEEARAKSFAPNAIYKRQENTSYKFIKPLLDSEYSNKSEGTRYYAYERVMDAQITQRINKDPDIKTSVYYDDLTNLSWVGVNETDKFNLGSLGKMPLMIAYYQLAEQDPTLFSQEIHLDFPDQNQMKNIQSPETRIEVGKTYKVGDLIKAMIQNSDNNASFALYAYKKEALRNIFQDLDAPLPQKSTDEEASDYINPLQYSQFFIVLYNSSYLNRTDSEAALKLLSQSEFTEGLVAGIPSNTVIAHKFGERGVADSNGKLSSYELHDCGIIYHPTRPYELCVMTKIENPVDINAALANQKAMIKDISAIVYRQSSAQ